MATSILVLLTFLLQLSPANGRAASLLKQDLQVDMNERPVMKVVRLLQDMKAELEHALKDDQEVHEMLSCWCETNRREKTAAIEQGEARVTQLEATIGEALARIRELKAKRKEAMDELDKDHAALETAATMRMKENKAFHAKETDLIEAAKACNQAVVVLSKHHPELAQVREIAQLLQRAQVPHLVQASGFLRRDQLSALQGFLAEAQGASSFLAIPGFRSYAPQSGQIFGILKQMSADFSAHLGEEQKAEAKAVAAFKDLKAAKTEEIAAGEKLVENIDVELAELGEKHAQALKELEETEEQLALDKTFLANLEKKCSESAEEFDARMKSRQEEIVAVTDTIGILNSDEAFDTFEKTVSTPSFLQKSSVVSMEERAARESAAAVLQKAARATGAPQLALIAAATHLDTFAKVIAEIDRLVEELNKQQSDEVVHRDWCIKEMDDNTKETAAADHKIENLQAKIADLEKSIETLNADIKAAKEAIAEMQVQMKRSGETRELENHDFQQTITEQRLTQIILTKATERMKEVYALMQQPGAPHIQTSGTHTDPGNGPARFTKYEQNAGGGRVIAMLQEVLADSHKLENEAINAEKDSQLTYELFMKESNKSIKQESASIASMSEALAKAKVSLSMSKEDLKQTLTELEGLNQVLGDLHRSCDFILKNFDARQEARAAEVVALREAKAILSGMK